MNAPACTAISAQDTSVALPVAFSPAAATSRALAPSSSIYRDSATSDSPLPMASTVGAPSADLATAIKPPLGLFGKLCAAFHEWRVERRMRNLATDMDPHIMQDVGVPDWLVNETTVQRELSRIRNTEYMRW